MAALPDSEACEGSVTAPPVHLILRCYLAELVFRYIANPVTASTIRTLEWQVDRAIILRRHHYRLSDVRSNTVLVLVRLNNALLVCTLLLSSVALVRVLPRVNLTCHLIVEVGADDLYTTGSAIPLACLVLVVPRKRTCILAVLPPHHRLVRRRQALNCAKRTIVWELTINGWLTGLAIKCAGPLGLRLRQPINLRGLLLKHETPIGNAGASWAGGEVPRLLYAVRARGVSAGVHITSGNDGVLILVWVFAPHTDFELAGASQVERRGTNPISHFAGQVEGKATLGVRQGVEHRGNFVFAGDVLQVDNTALQRLIVRRKIVMSAVLIDVRVAVVATIIAPATLGVNGVRNLLILDGVVNSSVRAGNRRSGLLGKRNRLCQRRNERKRKCCRSDRGTTTNLVGASHNNSFHSLI